MRLLLVGGGPAGSRAVMQAREPGADVTLLEVTSAPGMNRPDADHLAKEG